MAVFRYARRYEVLAAERCTFVAAGDGDGAIWREIKQEARRKPLTLAQSQRSLSALRSGLASLLRARVEPCQFS